MARCASCNKFTGEEASAEVNHIDVDVSNFPEARVSASVRMVKSCLECGDEVKECDLEIEDYVELPDDWAEDADIDIEEDGDPEVEDRCPNPVNPKTGKQTPYRYRKTLYGARLAYKITLKGQEPFEGELFDEVSASEFNEL